MTMTFARKAVLAGWLCLPLGAWAYHEGPGQDRMRLDDVAELLDRARAQVDGERWDDAIATFDDALEALPEGQQTEAWRIRLELDKAKMMASGLPEAHSDLRGLVDELIAAEDVDPLLVDDARAAFASAQFYMTWLMRLEGQPRDKWELEIDAARQTYRLLAERAEARGDFVAAEKRREDLESAVRLARMEVKDLQGLPLPSQ